MLVFLDIDGVMVPAANWKSPENLEDGFPMFSKKAVEALSGILDKDSEVVLTTSHKMRFTLQEWKMIFEKRGVRVEKLSRLNTHTSLIRRKDDLLNWFNSHTFDDNFVIIDDDSSLHDLPEYLKKNWIQTRPLVGLTPELISEG
ncbi:MAG: HAD domain-containing protein [Bacteroidota bacterium]